MTNMFTLVAALIGAVIGSLGSVWLQDFLERKSIAEQERNEVARQYLYQLQDSAEGLWFRLRNISHMQGRSVMSEGYFEVSTLYALGRALAAEQLLHIDGIYSRIDNIDDNLSDELRGNRIDHAIQEMDFYRYHRIALAETAMTPIDGSFRLSTYLEFRNKYIEELALASDNPVSSFEQKFSDTGDSWVLAARSAINEMDSGTQARVMENLHFLSIRLSEFTGVSTSIPSK